MAKKIKTYEQVYTYRNGKKVYLEKNLTSLLKSQTGRSEKKVFQEIGKCLASFK